MQARKVGLDFCFSRLPQRHGSWLSLVRCSWFMAHGACFLAHVSWVMAHGTFMVPGSWLILVISN